MNKDVERKSQNQNQLDNSEFMVFFDKSHRKFEKVNLRSKIGIGERI